MPLNVWFQSGWLRCASSFFAYWQYPMWDQLLRKHCCVWSYRKWWPFEWHWIKGDSAMYSLINRTLNPVRNSANKTHWSTCYLPPARVVRPSRIEAHQSESRMGWNQAVGRSPCVNGRHRTCSSLGESGPWCTPWRRTSYRLRSGPVARWCTCTNR